MSEKFKSESCWTCRHSYMEVLMTGRTYKCHIHADKAMNMNAAFKPTDCKDWER